MRTGLKILHIIFFLLLLGSGDFQVRGLTVTGKVVPIEALRGEDVTIPCLLSGIPIPLNLQILSVIWTLRLRNGTEYNVYQFQGSHHQSLRPGSHMNDRDLQQGNASLSIANIQITDEGDYRCFVIITPDAGTATSTLHVSVKPQISMRYKRLIEGGYVGSVFCNVSNFYPEEVKIRWVKHSNCIITNSSLDEDVCLKQFRKSDGTFNVISDLTVRPDNRDKPGDVFTCIVSHKTLKEEFSLHFTVPRWRPWMRVFLSTLCISTILLVCFLIYFMVEFGELRLWIYIFLSCSSILFLIRLAYNGRFLWKYFTIGDLTVSEISGNDYITHMKRTTLTCQITDFRQKEIQINIYLKRSNDIKKHLITSWESNNSSDFLMMTGDQRDNSPILPLLEEGAASRTLLPVKIESEIRKSWTGMYKCLCSITITPRRKTDNGAVIGVEVEHASLKRPVSVRRTLNVYSRVGDFQVRGLTVTGKDVPIEALRGENVTIPCLLSGVLIPLNLKIVSVVWSHRLQNGTEYKVHQVHESHHQSWRNGSHMNDSDLQQGNASLYIPNIQIKDEGEYICFVIVTPDAGTATSTLHVSVKPQTTLNYDKHIEAGIPGSVFCEINNFYPEALKVRWVKYSITTDTESYLDRDGSLTIPLRNSDGTFNVTSLLTVRQSTGIEPGDVLFCIVSHRSLKEEITLDFIMPSWSPLKDIVFSLFAFCLITFVTYFLKMYFKKGRRPWIHTVMRFIFITSCIMIVCLIVSLISSLVATDDVRVKIYIALSGIIITYLIGMHFDMSFWRFFKLGEPSLFEISGDRYIPQMKRTTLTCQITNFRQKEIQINVYLKRCHEIKRQLIASWNSTDQISSNKLSIAGDQRDNKVDTLPLLEKGDESRTLLPVVMDVKMTKSWNGLYNCACSITITPSADKDEGAVLAVEVEHASLKSPISVYRTLTVYKDNKPSLWRRCKKYVSK